MNNRRQFLAGSGVAALALLTPSTKLWAQDSKPAKNDKKLDSTNLEALAKSTAECVRAGEACVAFCAKEFAEGRVAMMANCNIKVHEMLALTKAMLSLASMGSPAAIQLASLCADACHACAEACAEHKEHFAHMHVCKECMEACQHCEKVCRKLLA